MSTKPTKGRPLTTDGSRVAAARSGPKLSLFTVALIAVLGVIAVVAVGFVVARVADDGSDDTDSTATEETQVFGPITVEGEPLPDFEQTEGDPAVGEPAPTVIGESPTGEPVEIEPGSEPMVIAFVAHWCPHCQAEVPRIVELMDDDGTVDGVKVVAVLTGSDEAKGNWPPAQWLEDEGWTAPVMVDSDTQEALIAYGAAGYPYLVALDADGNVFARASGEQEGGPAAFFEAVAAQA